MKLGELKIASLMLIAPSLEINLDTTEEASIAYKIMELKANPNVSDYLSHMPFAINRSFSIIEGCGASKTKYIKISPDKLEKAPRGYIVKLDEISDDILYVEKAYQGGPCSFFAEGDGTILVRTNKKEELELYYKSRLMRVNESTSDLYELDLENRIADIIPYFIKSELLLSEEPDEAKLAREHFLELLKPFLKKATVHNDVSVDTVFAIE